MLRLVDDFVVIAENEQKTLEIRMNNTYTKTIAHKNKSTGTDMY